MTDKSYFYMLLLLFSQLLFSCGAEESLDASLGDSRAVRFSGSAAALSSRAAASLVAQEHIPDGQSIGVYAYYHDNSRWSATARPDFMFNQQATYRTAQDVFNYSPVKYWPNEENDKLSFVAYYPYTDYPVAAPYAVSDAETATGIKPQLANSGQGLPTFWFTVNDDVTRQVDFMVSGLRPNLPISRALDDAPGTPFNNLSVTDRVDFIFRHATAKVQFLVEVDEEIRDDVTSFSINSLQLNQVNSRGLLTPSYDPETDLTALNWSGHTRLHDYTISPVYDGDAAATVLSSKTYLLLPQPLGNDVTLTMNYQMTFNRGGTVYTYDADGNVVTVGDSGYSYANPSVSVRMNTLDVAEWLPNAQYVYVIRLGAKRIEFTAQVVDWGAYIDPFEITLTEQ